METWAVETLRECTRYGYLWRIEKIQPGKWLLLRCGRIGDNIYSKGKPRMFKIWAEFAGKIPEVGDYLFQDYETKATTLLRIGDSAKTDVKSTLESQNLSPVRKIGDITHDQNWGLTCRGLIYKVGNPAGS